MVGRDTAGGRDTTIPPGLPFTTIIKRVTFMCLFLEPINTCSVGGVARVRTGVIIYIFGAIKSSQI